jgi:hypothetical protein
MIKAGNTEVNAKIKHRVTSLSKKSIYMKKCNAFPVRWVYLAVPAGQKGFTAKKITLI